VAAAFARLARHAAVDPALVLASGLRAGADLADVTVGRSSVQPAKGDKRFAHPAWAHNPIYRRLMQAYLVDATAVMRLVDEVDLDPKSRERARFALTLLVEALAPTNTLAGNPSALAKAVETRGRSLVTGLRHLAGDIRRNGGVPSTVDTRPFRVGDNIATTAGHVVHRTDVFELIQYEAQTETVAARPLVAIPPQINKYYITDLAPGRSLVEHMVRAGFPYFAMSWRNPTAAHRDWNLDIYVAACKEAIEVACEITGADGADVAGICAGGITMGCLLGHLAATSDDIVASATFLVAGLLERRHDQAPRRSPFRFPRPVHLQWPGRRDDDRARRARRSAGGRCRHVRGRRVDRPHRPVASGVPHDPTHRRRDRLRAELERPHPGHGQPARKPEVFAPHRERDAPGRPG
jgi:polyhydroxyalkanoate synthase